MKSLVAFKTVSVIILLMLTLTAKLFSQELSVVDSSSVKIEELPKYVVITSENTKLFGGINIIIDYKKSPYEDVLMKLEKLLQSRKKLKIRNQTDMLNTMAQLGFEYVDAYNANAGTIGAGGGDAVDIFGSQSKFRINMVFRKKEEHR